MTIAVGYGMGRRDDPIDRPGLAHLTEHLTFRRSQHLGDYRAPGRIESAGGFTNGFTSNDATIYVADGPAELLAAMLWIERERMAFVTSALRQDDLEAERGVVVQELLERDTIFRRRYRYEMQAFFGAAHPLVTSPEEPREVARHTLEDVRWFLQTAYRPDNAVLVVVGAFDVGAARRLVGDLLGTLIAAPQKVPRTSSVKPALRHRTLSVFHATRQEHVSLLWLRPATTRWAVMNIFAHALWLRVLTSRLERLSLHAHMSAARFRTEELVRVHAQATVDTPLAELEHTLVALVQQSLRLPFDAASVSAGRAGAELKELHLISDQFNYAYAAANAVLLGLPATHATRMAALAQVVPDDLSKVAAELQREPMLRSRLLHEEEQFEERVVREDPTDAP